MTRKLHGPHRLEYCPVPPLALARGNCAAVMRRFVQLQDYLLGGQPRDQVGAFGVSSGGAALLPIDSARAGAPLPDSRGSER